MQGSCVGLNLGFARQSKRSAEKTFEQIYAIIRRGLIRTVLRHLQQSSHNLFQTIYVPVRLGEKNYFSDRKGFAETLKTYLIR
jgi:hypothetical protein